MEHSYAIDNDMQLTMWSSRHLSANYHVAC